LVTVEPTTSAPQEEPHINEPIFLYAPALAALRGKIGVN